MIVVAGAGWTGAVIAHRLAEAGHHVEVHDSRDHVGGNCYTERRHGITVHVYGPHIFHTDRQDVWDWLQQWTEWVPYRHTVRAHADGGVWSMPVNLHTINQLYGAQWSPAQAAKVLKCWHPGDTFEAAAINAVGPQLYALLFRGYTQKMWGCDPAELPASVFHRLPVRFSYDDSYYRHPVVAMPRDGYTPIFEKLLDHPNIDVRLGSTVSRPVAEWTFWSGPLDEWFGGDDLGYRGLKFQHIISAGDYQGVAQLNLCDADEPATRQVEHKHLSPWEHHERTYVTREIPTSDVRFYPTRLPRDLALLEQYRLFAERERRVTFCGRLGTYRYIDMDVAISEALHVADRWLQGDRRAFYA